MMRNRIIFENKENLDWRFNIKDLTTIKRLWTKGKSIRYICKEIGRNEHEVFLSLYEMWMEGKVEHLERAFMKGSTLLVPGREQLESQKGNRKAI